MEENNPLQVCSPLTPAVTNDKNYNKSGRPNTKDIVKFSPQPKSMVAQMLCEMRTIKEDTNETIHIDDLTEDSEDVDKSEDYVCPFCSHISSTPDELKRHLAKHKKFTCDFPNCNYSCKLSSNLIKHKRMHTNDKPYLCERCCFRSNFVNSLKAHKRTHTAERPYQCAHCSYKCNSSSNLKKHCRHRHPGTSDCQCAKTS